MFAGIGGFREGLCRAGGFECVGHCERDEHAERSYRALFDTRGEWFCEDIRKADPDEMPDFDLLCGGFFLVRGDAYRLTRSKSNILSNGV